MSVVATKHPIVSPHAQASTLRLQRLSKSFGDRQVLPVLDLQVAPGEFVAIVGRSGSGKSTLLRLLAGLEAPTGGAIEIDGTPLVGLNRAARMMFQDARLLPWMTVLENVGIERQPEWRQQAEHVLSLVGLAGREGDWPATLSGGQRQRVALARALVSRPRLLLLDEPLGSVDALTRLEMQQLIEGLWQRRGMTAVLVTHDVEEAVALADRVLVLEAGRIVLAVEVPLPRPRRRDDAHFGSLVQRVLDRVLDTDEAPREPSYYCQRGQ
ncbi:MAG: ATP-binding cassette domain-containing protein [Pirellulales bacterium]|nr:ATP-binding cassette domain-containing protein [Pirellulales bacterium]